MQTRTYLTAMLIVTFFLASGLAQATTNADILFQQNKWPEAKTAYEAELQRNPTDGRSWFRLGICSHELGEYEKALTAYQHAADLQFTPPPFAVRLARTYAKLGQTDAAILQLQKLPQGFRNVALLQSSDFDSIRQDPSFQKAVNQAQRNLTPCRFSPEFRSFDFWIGEWTVIANGQTAGTSSVQLILDECVIFENWTSADGYAGKSFNLYNPAIRKWQQLWVDNSGASLQLTGSYSDGVLLLTGETTQSDGIVYERLAFHKLGETQVRQVWEQSSDQGKSWNTVFDGLYTKK